VSKGGARGGLEGVKVGGEAASQKKVIEGDRQVDLAAHANSIVRNKDVRVSAAKGVWKEGRAGSVTKGDGPRLYLRKEGEVNNTS